MVSTSKGSFQTPNASDQTLWPQSHWHLKQKHIFNPELTVKRKRLNLWPHSFGVLVGFCEFGRCFGLSSSTWVTAVLSQHFSTGYRHVCSAKSFSKASQICGFCRRRAAPSNSVLANVTWWTFVGVEHAFYHIIENCQLLRWHTVDYIISWEE